MTQLTIFYDGNCPLCAREILALRTRDDKKRLRFENIYDADFLYRYPYIDISRADRILHGQMSDGRMLYGLDVTAKAWALVDSHRWIQVLRWPVIRWFADFAYYGFARLRHPIGLLLGRQKSCGKDSCKG